MTLMHCAVGSGDDDEVLRQHEYAMSWAVVMMRKRHGQRGWWRRLVFVGRLAQQWREREREREAESVRRKVEK
jgi:hypothetical protein